MKNSKFGVCSWLGSFLLALVVATIPLHGRALAGGSIVINNRAPSEDLVLNDDSGATQPLRVSWNDIQVLDGLRRHLAKEFGSAADNVSYSIDSRAEVVRYTNPTNGSSVVIAFVDLL
jgi:hypothetical protein